MKKIFLSLFCIALFAPIYGQAYQQINVSNPEYNTVRSYSGVDVVGITLQSEGAYAVTFFNNNSNDYGCRTSYNFDWYLSYKGKRVSDYFNSSVRCRKQKQETVYAWPGDVPKGYEKYVTVQFGKETPKKDRRDDY